MMNSEDGDCARGYREKEDSDVVNSEDGDV
jgi:hypothetical protein